VSDERAGEDCREAQGKVGGEVDDRDDSGALVWCGQGRDRPDRALKAAAEPDPSDGRTGEEQRLGAYGRGEKRNGNTGEQGGGTDQHHGARRGASQQWDGKRRARGEDE
jgi:hypothetical protein